MGTRQRREREKREVRQGILTAAREIAREEGWQAVTIRKVAECIEYSPSMIYEYFESKEAILLELHSEGFQLLALALATARVSSEDYEERLLQMGEAYWEFALRHPELYQVMHGLNGVPLDCSGKIRAHEAFDVTVQALGDWSESLGIEMREMTELAIAVEMFRAFLHGLVCLHMEHHLHADARSLLRRGVHDLLAAWRLSFQG